MTPEAIQEAAFQIYWRFARGDEERARQRFARLKDHQREDWEADAKAAAQAEYEARIRSALVAAPAAGMEAAVEAATKAFFAVPQLYPEVGDMRAALEAALSHLSAALSRPVEPIQPTNSGE